MRHDIAQRGLISLPFGSGRHAPVAAENQGRVIATILANPEPHVGKTYSLFGPVEMDPNGIAKAVGKHVEIQVRY